MKVLDTSQDPTAIPRELKPSRMIRKLDPQWSAKIAPESLEHLAQIKQKMNEKRWLSERWFCVHQVTAWFLVFLLCFVSTLMTMAYGMQFGNEQTLIMLSGWAIALAWCFVIIEPFQIVFVFFVPKLIDPDSRCGRCIDWTRWTYNEYFSP